MKAKLQNNTLGYATNFEKIGEDWVTNPTEAQLKNAGFKDTVYQEIDEIVNPYNETDTEIIIYTQRPKAQTNTDVEALRQQAYLTESNPIMFAFRQYEMLNETQKAEAKRAEWMAKIAEIRERYPYLIM